MQFLGTHGIEIQIPSTATPNLSSWVVTCRGKNCFVDELHLRNPGHNPTSFELLLERSIAKESEFCCTEMEQFRIEETHATLFEIQTNPVCSSKEVILVGERKWNDILAYSSFKGDSLIKMNEKLTALFIGIRCVTNCKEHFSSLENESSRTQIGFNTHIHEGSNKMRIQYCMTSKKILIVYSCHSRTHWWEFDGA